MYMRVLFCEFFQNPPCSYFTEVKCVVNNFIGRNMINLQFACHFSIVTLLLSRISMHPCPVFHSVVDVFGSPDHSSSGTLVQPFLNIQLLSFLTLSMILFVIQNQRFRDWTLLHPYVKSLLSWAQSIELDYISRHFWKCRSIHHTCCIVAIVSLINFHISYLQSTKIESLHTSLPWYMW